VSELRALDYRLKQRDMSEHSPDIAIVAVDNKSLERYGRWPWPRARVAEVIDRISAAKPSVIGVDGVWSEEATECNVGAFGTEVSAGCRGELTQALGSSRSGDQKLADAIAASGGIVLGYFFDFDRRSESSSKWEGEGAYAIVRSEAGGIGENRVRLATAVTRNLPMINDAAKSRGYFNFFPDSADGLFRRVPMVIRFAGRMVTPLSLTMLAVHWPERPLSIGFGPFGVTSIKLGNESIPVADDGQMLLNYRGRQKTFPHYSASDLIDGQVPAEALRDKFVLVGVTATAVGDIRATPLDGIYPGVEIHATALDNILRRDFVSQAADKGLTWASLADVGVILFGTLLLAYSLRYLRGVRGALVAAVIMAAFLGGSQTFFSQSGVALRVVYPTLAFALTYLAVSVHHYVAAERETRETRRMLDLYLSPSVARELSLHPEMIKLGGEKSERTVLFSDVKSFTSISERLAPEDLVELLNLYLGDMTDMVFAHDGMLDKYIGDGLMAVWGAPLPQVDHAARACHAALGMVERLHHVNEHGARRGWPELKIRIGLNSGEMVFGNMGSARHLSLTVMGDNVNLASRLEGISKLYGTTIIAAEATVQSAGDEFLMRELDWVRVRGKTQPVRIYELLGLRTHMDGWAPVLRHFADGLEAFRGQRWEEAGTAFEAAMHQRPGDGPSELYLRRCQQYMQQPPAASWEAVTLAE